MFSLLQGIEEVKEIPIIQNVNHSIINILLKIFLIITIKILEAHSIITCNIQIDFQMLLRNLQTNTMLLVIQQFNKFLIGQCQNIKKPNYLNYKSSKLQSCIKTCKPGKINRNKLPKCLENNNFRIFRKIMKFEKFKWIMRSCRNKLSNREYLIKTKN